MKSRSVMSSTRRRALGAGLCALIGAGAALALGAPAVAAGTGYVALGDSYSSGTGTRTYISDGTICQRSVYAYPCLIAAAPGYALNFRACSGATVADVTQHPAERADAARRPTSRSRWAATTPASPTCSPTCAQPGWASNCNGAIDGGPGLHQQHAARPRSTTLYSSIRAQAPQAKVIVVGYPRIFNGEDCNAAHLVLARPRSRGSTRPPTCSTPRRRRAAASAGLHLRQPDLAVRRPRRVRQPRVAQRPVQPGQRVLPPQHRRATRRLRASSAEAAFGLAVTLSASQAEAKAGASADALARDARRYAAVDRTITPERFVAPDLHDARGRRRRRPRRASTSSSRASIDAADRLYTARQDAAREIRGPR